jgi:hypothetical protein
MDGGDMYVSLLLFFQHRSSYTRAHYEPRATVFGVNALGSVRTALVGRERRGRRR